MHIFEALILGLVQGIAEFLPISSSGHLILARELLGLQTEQGLAVDAVLQFATALAVVLYFRTDLANLAKSALGTLHGVAMPRDHRVLITALVLGTLPAIAAGLLLEETMETTFRSAELVAWVLIAGSVLFALAEYMPRWIRRRPHGGEGGRDATDVLLPLTKGETGRGWWHRSELTVVRGVVIGFFQALALVPGMSRSGATISGGMLLGLSREHAARFAFLLSVPIILGSGAKKLLELEGAGIASAEWLMIGVASVTAFASGIASIHYLLRFLRSHTLWPFIWYRLALAAIVLMVAL